MIASQLPLVKEIENTWNVVNHNNFDGSLQNAFESTSRYA